MKRIFYVVSTIAAISLASCNKGDFDADKELVTDSKEFSAVIGGGLSTRTTIDGLKVKWESTDLININGSTYTATPDETDATKATFSKTAGEDPTATYHAIYPADFYVTDHFELPAALTYTAGKFNIPMYAESETTFLSFKNIFGVLKISVANTASVKSIAVSSDLYLNGTFTVAEDKASVADGSTANKTTTLTCDPAVAGTDFYIPVPAGTYTGKNLKVVLTKSDNSTETMTTKQSAAIVIAAGYMYTFDFKKDGSFILGESSKMITQENSIL